jgi:N-acetylneuraminic acid mutarotase
MSRGEIFVLFAAVLLVSFVFAGVGYCEAVGTAFTYQGRLIDANVAADGEYDLQFGLYDSNSDGNQVGGNIDVNDVDLIDGYFTVELDFGDVFDGEARWLEIGVRAGDSSGAFTLLSPRQELTATPYAQEAENGVPKGFMILGSTREIPAGYSPIGISVISGGGDSWETKAAMPSARKNAAAAAVGGKIYVIGGEYNMDNRWLTVVEEYEPETDTWATKASLPVGRRFHTAAAVGGKIYVFGGQNSSFGTVSTTYEYDPVGDTWTTKASMPTGRKYAGAAAVDGKIYVIGGQNSSGTPVATNEEYDPATNTWATKAAMPTARQQLGVASLGGKIYAIGGYNDLAENEEYDPVSDSWTSKSVMPTGREYLSVVSVINRIYAIGGMSTVRLNTNEKYNPESDTWSISAAIATFRSSLAAAVVDGRVYAIGGDTGGLTAIATNEEFSPEIELLIYMKD